MLINNQSGRQGAPKFWCPENERDHKFYSSILVFAGTIIFFPIQKGVLEAYFDRFVKNCEPRSTLKEGFLSRKRPKEGERLAPGHFHERLSETPVHELCLGFGPTPKSNQIKLSILRCVKSNISPSHSNAA